MLVIQTQIKKDKNELEYKCEIKIEKGNKSTITKEEIIKYTIQTLFAQLNGNEKGLNYEIKSLIRNELRKYKNDR